MPETNGNNVEVTETAEEHTRDLEMTELLQRVADWNPLIPDEVIDFYLEKSGVQTDDVRVKRLVSLAAQHFISNIASDAFQFARVRPNANAPSRRNERQKLVLTMDELSAALQEYNINARRSSYYL